MTTKFAVLGSPISHSKSPTLHQAAYEFLGLDFQYDMFDVDKSGFGDLLASAKDYLGFSLTMPLKELGFEIASVRDDYSQKTSAANTLVRKDESWQAYNTDVFGISQALANLTKGTKSEINNISVLGTGATSRSVFVAISELFPDSQVSVWGRTQSNVDSLTHFGASLGLECHEVKDLRLSVEGAHLTISTLPSGSIDEFWTDFREQKRFIPQGHLFDVSYHPWPSKAATAWGSQKVISGIEMLLYQAVRQVRIFAAAAKQDVSASDEAIADAMRKAIS